MDLDAAVTFAVTLPSLLVAHAVADDWVQTHDQGTRKGLPGRLHAGVQESWDNPSLGTGAYQLDQSWHWA